MAKITVCTECGAKNKNKYVNSKSIKCKSCDEYIIVDIASNLAEVKKSEFKQVRKLKDQRDEALLMSNFEEVKTTAMELIAINPYDYYSAYLLAYAKHKSGDSNSLLSFYGKPIHVLTYELQLIATHILRNFDVTHHAKVMNYLSNLPIGDSTLYKDAYLKSYEEQMNLVNVNVSSKNIFISYNEKDLAAAKLVEGFIAGTKYSYLTSKLPTGADSSKILTRCNLVLVVASEESMRANNIIRDVKAAAEVNIPMIEIKLDKAERSALFTKEFDSGLSIDAKKITPKMFKKLLPMIDTQIKGVLNQVIEFENNQYCDYSDSEIQAINHAENDNYKLRFELLIKRYENLKNIINANNIEITEPKVQEENDNEESNETSNTEGATTAEGSNTQTAEEEAPYVPQYVPENFDGLGFGSNDEESNNEVKEGTNTQEESNTESNSDVENEVEDVTETTEENNEVEDINDDVETEVEEVTSKKGKKGKKGKK